MNPPFDPAHTLAIPDRHVRATEELRAENRMRAAHEMLDAVRPVGVTVGFILAHRPLAYAMAACEEWEL